jgi:hypothetical protein
VKPRLNLRAASVAWTCGLLFVLATLAGCSSSHHPAKPLLQGSSSSSAADPTNRLIVLGRSIAGIALGVPRKSVEKALGRGTPKSRGVVSYFGRRLLVDYWFHDRLTTRVQGLETTWPGFHTRSGVRVGTTLRALRVLRVACSDGKCSRGAGRRPDAPGTVFTMRRGKVSQVDIFYA